MEMMPGYMRTDVGVIPNSWSVKTIGQITTCTAGGTPSTKISTYWGGSIPWMSSGELNLKYVDDVLERITKEGLTNSSTKLIPENCVLVGLAGQGKTRGTVAINLIPLCTNQSIAAILPSESFISTYLYFNLDSRYHELRNLSSGGGGRGGLNLRIIKSMQVPLPPLDEQLRIAQTLTDLDNLLFALDKNIVKKRDVKHAAMQQLLTGKARLPGFDKTWETFRLGQVSTMGSGGTPLSSEASYYGGDIPWVAISDMTNTSKLIWSTSKNLSKKGLSNSSAQIFPAGTVLYAMYASLGECSIAGVPLCTSQAILGIQPNKTLSNEFLYYYLTSLKTKVKTIGQQGTQSNLNKGMVQAFSINLPPIDEQIAIANVLSDMDEEILKLEKRRNKTKDLKQAMMQELLTGNTRLINEGLSNA